MEGKDKEQIDAEEEYKERLREKEQVNKAIYCLTFLVLIGVAVFCFVYGIVPVGVMSVCVSLPILYGIVRRTRFYENLKSEKKEKMSNALTIVVLIVLLLVVVVAVGSCVSVIGSKSNYEPTTHDVLKWYDQKDDEGNYVNRGEYNQKRSY